MALGLVGRKLGMTRLFSDNGDSVPVSVIEVLDNRIAQIKTVAKDGYDAVQVAYGQRRASRITMPQKGHLAKHEVGSAEGLKEFRVPSLEGFTSGQEVPVSLFAVGQKVDVTATSIGKGFAGGIKRHHFNANRSSHGNSVSHRSPGSIGQNQDPGRVFPGKRMAGHLGAVKRKMVALEVVKVDAERQLLFVKGAVPGSTEARVVVEVSTRGGMPS